MTLTIVLLVVAVIAAAIGFSKAAAARATTERVRAEIDRAAAERDGARQELAAIRSELGALKGRLADSAAEVAKSRDELKKTKKKAQSRGQESDGLAKRVADLAQQQAALGGIDEARDAMVFAQTEAANLRQRVRQLESELSSRRESPRAEPPRTMALAATDSADGQRPQPSSVDPSAVAAAAERLVADAQRDARRAADDAVRKERSQFAEELKSLRKRLQKALADMDKERRRADNNDKAYGILKAQLENALDRLSAAEPNLRRPDALSPGDLEREARARRAARPARTDPPGQGAETPASGAAADAEEMAATGPADGADPDPSHAAATTPDDDIVTSAYAAVERQVSDPPAGDALVDAPSSSEAPSAPVVAEAATALPAPEVPSDDAAAGAAPSSTLDDDGWDLDDSDLAKLEQP